MALDLDAFLEKTYNFSEPTWLAARDWLTLRLRAVARSQKTISYGELCDEMRTKGIAELEPHGTPFAALLGQINVVEHDGGKPLLSAVVVNKDTMEPGVGFWNIARDLGLEPGDTEAKREKFWLDSLRECHAQWGTAIS